MLWFNENTNHLAYVWVSSTYNTPRAFLNINLRIRLIRRIVNSASPTLPVMFNGRIAKYFNHILSIKKYYLYGICRCLYNLISNSICVNEDFIVLGFNELI